jgi:FHA domain-containing protein
VVDIEIRDGVVMDTKPSYVITVTENGDLQTYSVEKFPFYIGSREESDLRLQGAKIQPTHIRLLCTSDNRILIISLSDGVKLNGEPLKVFQPTTWLMHGQITLGTYQLNLESRGSQRVVISQAESQSVSQQKLDFSGLQFPRTEGVDSDAFKQEPIALETSSNGHAVSESKSDVEIVEETGLIDSVKEDFVPPSNSPLMNEPPTMADPINPASSFIKEPSTMADPISHLRASRQPSYHETDKLPDLRQTSQEELPQFDEPITQSWNGDTLPKEWIQGQDISVQVAYSPINAALGEWVSVPISVRSHLMQSISLQMMVAGEQLDWDLDYPRSIQLESQALITLDIALQIPLKAQVGRAIFRVYLSASVPQVDTSIDFILNFVIKHNPNMSGILSPDIVHDGQTAYFLLRNLTLVTMQVGIDSAMVTDTFDIECHEKLLDLTPGQALKVPVTFQAKQRSWIVSRKEVYYLRVMTTNRAPVRFNGSVLIRSRLLAFLGSLLLRYTLLILDVLLIGFLLWWILWM